MEYWCYRKGIICEPPLKVHIWRTKGIKEILSLKNGSKQSLNRFLYELLGKPDGFTSDISDAIGMGIYWCKTKFPNSEMKIHTDK